MSEEDRLSSDADFKPNLVNSVCYMVEQVCVGVLAVTQQCDVCQMAIRQAVPVRRQSTSVLAARALLWL